MIVVGIVGIFGLVAFIRMDATRWTKIAAIKQILNFSQVLALTTLVSVQWPPMFRKAADWFSKLTNVFDVDSVGPECFSPQFTNWDNRFMVTVAGFSGISLSVVAAMVVVSFVARTPPLPANGLPAAHAAGSRRFHELGRGRVNEQQLGRQFDELLPAVQATVDTLHHGLAI